MHNHYYCPDCEGSGEVSTSPNALDPDAWQTCLRCGGNYTIDGEELECGESARPYTPSLRRRYGKPGTDILESISRGRKAKRFYDSYRHHARKIGAHTYAGLMQSDMLARATMCATVSDNAVQAWRKQS